eukprot:TRINITY_DN37155_c0_g1_i1.p1 TRINITY_DN37155_c0_g1~~TRINITY_DN37155_c0_g1_i1.p1  ORF type:complete len:533 (-),score=144.51 TRINITY_DN37155_c0_g1_i1:90-1688(-)
MLVQVGRRCVSEQREIDITFAKGMKELLGKSKVFQDCHDEFIRDLIVSSSRKEYAPNRYLMEEGSRGESMFVLYKGVVEVTSGGRYVCKLRDGSIVGEAALLNIDNRRTASVRSVQKCDVAIIFRSTFHSILEKYPWEKKKFQREMKGKLMELGKLIDVKDDINLEQQAIQCDALKKVPFFANDESMHDFVAELAMTASSYWFRAGRVIIQEGDTRCDEMYVLLKGAVEVTACGQFLGRLENDLFGEICVLDLLERRTANVIAATQCHCMMFSRQIVIPVLGKYPDARMKLLKHARQRLVALNEAISTSAEKPASGARLPGCAIGFGSALQMTEAQLFAANPIFRDAKVDFLVDLCGLMAQKKYEEGQTLIKQGDVFSAAKGIFGFIFKGEAEVWRDGTLLKILGEGDFFGELEIGVGSGGVYKNTVTSRSRLQVLTVRPSEIVDLIRKHRDSALDQNLSAEMDRRRAEWGKSKAKPPVAPMSLEVMFMKLPQHDKTGVLMPTNVPLAHSIKLGSAETARRLSIGGSVGTAT